MVENTLLKFRGEPNTLIDRVYLLGIG